MDCGGGDQGEMEGARGREKGKRECHTVVRTRDRLVPCWENKESCCCFLSKVPSMILHLASPIIIYRVQSLAHSSSFALVLDGAGGFSASPFRPSPGTIRVVSESYAYITNIAFTPNPAQCLRLSSPRHFLLLLLLLLLVLLLLLYLFVWAGALASCRRLRPSWGRGTRIDRRTERRTSSTTTLTQTQPPTLHSLNSLNSPRWRRRRRRTRRTRSPRRMICGRVWPRCR